MKEVPMGATRPAPGRSTSGAAITVNRLGFAAMRITRSRNLGRTALPEPGSGRAAAGVELGPGGTASSTSPTSLVTDFGVVPLHEFGNNDASRSPRS
jgi:hypothetical protein